MVNTTAATRDKKLASFQETMLPHMDAAFNLARWIVSYNEDAQDVVQESFLKAYSYYDSYTPGNPKAWLLMIVRNCAYSWLSTYQKHSGNVVFDEDVHGADDNLLIHPMMSTSASTDPARRIDQHQRIDIALQRLPVILREIVLLREVGGLTYAEIADAIDAPIGTVMSRLARARQRLSQQLKSIEKKEVKRKSEMPRNP